MALPEHDAVWYDNMYNNRALVPNHGDYIRRWTDRSAQVRHSHGAVAEVAYGDAPSENLDIFPATGLQGEARAPVMVFVHGGYWMALDKADHSFVAPAFTQLGCCVVVVNYALCPGSVEAPVSIPVIMDQMERALGWIWQNIADYGGDPGRITVAGHSAGGQIAAMLLRNEWHAKYPGLTGPVVRSALSISGLHDLEPLMHVERYQSVLRLTPTQIQAMSPARQPAPNQGELYCAVGGDESVEFLRQNQLLQRAWGAGVVPQCTALAGLNHFSVLDTLAEPGQTLHAMALKLLRA